MTPLDNIFAELSTLGWLVNNLYQLDDSSWHVNLRSANHFTAFAEASDLRSVLELALDTIASAEYVPARPTTFSSEVSVNSILANLLKRPPAQRINRRI